MHIKYGPKITFFFHTNKFGTMIKNSQSSLPNLRTCGGEGPKQVGKAKRINFGLFQQYFLI